MKLLHSFALAALIAFPPALPAVAQDAAPPPPRPQRGGDSAPQTPPAQPSAPVADAPDAAAQSADDTGEAPLTKGLAGPYLAGRVAATDSNFAAAADYYIKALKQDPTSPFLNDSTLVSLVAAGQVDQAIAMADKMFAADSAVSPSAIAGLIERAKLAKAQDWDALLVMIDASRNGGDGERRLLDGIMRAWALLGAGRAADADEAFLETAKIPGVGGLVGYHRALSKALVGDFEGAADLLASGDQQRSIVGAIFEAQVLSQLDRRDDAIKVLESVQLDGVDDAASALKAQLEAGEPVAFDVIKDPRDGIAQAFLTFATLLSNDVDPTPLSLVHARLASYLSLDMADARLMVAQMLQAAGQFDAAESEFNTLRDSGQMRPMSELARIDALARAERSDEAMSAAIALTEAKPEMAAAWMALGDLQRQQDQWAEAIVSYDRAIEHTDPADKDALWFPLYARGIAHERDGQFDKAEADLKAALEIQPDNPQMLNYLGYSYVDRGENLDEALRLIQRAVDLSPDDGYILDSLGWVFYRLGRYDEAVAPQERAVAAMASDPLVNDHLGDIYWMVGRKREAEIQWMRALSFKPETEEESWRIRSKLERGLDAVLAEEAENGGKLLPPPAPEPTDEGDDGTDAVPPAE
ncbi:tetratricopeptide repeat protein [Paracoccus aurantiacus]|uniref:Tetratricopeptide repeat protein n=1 Tax=Paracoccus aurantiacus TaxID=2599412 RepID=A0A5C6S3G3_9RHOB|nr:tetratricopeptide repeat protein [Paracoccus aurantiacus]TXB68102.1 tetratricopeptide repeat protein [Paracoccus aurantiacus]